MHTIHSETRQLINELYKTSLEHSARVTVFKWAIKVNALDELIDYGVCYITGNRVLYYLFGTEKLLLATPLSSLYIMDDNTNINACRPIHGGNKNGVSWAKIAPFAKGSYHSFLRNVYHVKLETIHYGFQE